MTKAGVGGANGGHGHSEHVGTGVRGARVHTMHERFDIGGDEPKARVEPPVYASRSPYRAESGNEMSGN